MNAPAPNALPDPRHFNAVLDDTPPCPACGAVLAGALHPEPRWYCTECAFTAGGFSGADIATLAVQERGEALAIARAVIVLRDALPAIHQCFGTAPALLSAALASQLAELLASNTVPADLADAHEELARDTGEAVLHSATLHYPGEPAVQV